MTDQGGQQLVAIIAVLGIIVIARLALDGRTDGMILGAEIGRSVAAIKSTERYRPSFVQPPFTVRFCSSGFTESVP